MQQLDVFEYLDNKKSDIEKIFTRESATLGGPREQSRFILGPGNARTIWSKYFKFWYPKIQ